MDIEQVKKDFDNGVMICRGTWARVLEAALDMQRSLEDIQTRGDRVDEEASDCLERVGKL